MPKTKMRAAPATSARPTSWAARYGRAILADGIATIPIALYYYQAHLQLTAQEVWFTSAILAHKWSADLPCPSLKRMAAQTHMSLSQLQRIRASLCAKGYLQVQARFGPLGDQDANAYDFAVLFSRLEQVLAAEPFADNGIEEPALTPPPVEESGDMSFAARYGRVIARAGIAAIPQALFTHQATLDLTPQHVWFICYILAHRWSTELPHPSLIRMAARTGYTERYLRKLKDQLVAAGYLRLVPRQAPGGRTDTNGFDFGALLDAINQELQQEEPPPPVPVAPPRRGYHLRPAPTTASPNGNAAIGTASSSGSGVAPSSGTPVASSSRTGIAPGSGMGVAPSSGMGVASSSGIGVASSSGRGIRPVQQRAARNSGTGNASSSGTGIVSSSGEEEPQQEEQIPRKDSNRHERITERTTGIGQPPYSPYIAQVVLDLSRELGDHNGFSNVTQALRLWQSSGLGEEAFVQALYAAKQGVRKAQGHGVGNKGAYWFAVLRDHLGLDANTAVS